MGVGGVQILLISLVIRNRTHIKALFQYQDRMALNYTKKKKKSDRALRNDFRPWFFVRMQDETWTFKFMIRFLIHTLELKLWLFEAFS